MKKTFTENADTINAAADTINAALKVPAWDMASFERATRRVTDAAAADVFKMVSYITAYNRGQDYTTAREKAWAAYTKYTDAAAKVRAAIEYAEKRGGEMPIYKDKGEIVTADVYKARLIEKADKADARYMRMYNAALEDAAHLTPLGWADGEETAAALNFIDLSAAVMFGYDKPFKRANIGAVNAAINAAVTFANANAKAAGEKTDDTAAAFNKMRAAFVEMFTALCGVNIKFSAKECLYLASIFGGVGFSVGEVDEKTDVYVAGKTERENARQVYRLALYKLEGKKIGDEFK